MVGYANGDLGHKATVAKSVGWTGLAWEKKKDFFVENCSQTTVQQTDLKSNVELIFDLNKIKTNTEHQLGV